MAIWNRSAVSTISSSHTGRRRDFRVPKVTKLQLCRLLAICRNQNMQMIWKISPPMPDLHSWVFSIPFPRCFESQKWKYLKLLKGQIARGGILTDLICIFWLQLLQLYFYLSKKRTIYFFKKIISVWNFCCDWKNIFQKGKKWDALSTLPNKIPMRREFVLKTCKNPFVFSQQNSEKIWIFQLHRLIVWFVRA